ncbi:HNH/ENDO VII family nuclease [Bartonella taylorii]|uniref:HNH/ENDO VII family nuclease n=1 Tax=Bartonella taylorii TaxID=33046 RepID=UPI003CCF10D2
MKVFPSSHIYALQTQTSSMAEVTKETHHKHSFVIYINRNIIGSDIDKDKFNIIRQQYWKKCTKDYIQKITY